MGSHLTLRAIPRASRAALLGLTAPLHQDTRGIQSFHCLLQTAGVHLPLDFLPGGNVGKRNRFVKVTQRSEWSEPTEFSKLQSFLKLPKSPGYELQQPQEAQSCSHGRQLCYTTVSAPFPGTLPLQCLLTASSKKLIGKKLQIKSLCCQEVHPTPRQLVPCNSLLESWMNIFLNQSKKIMNQSTVHA